MTELPAAGLGLSGQQSLAGEPRSGGEAQWCHALWSGDDGGGGVVRFIRRRARYLRIYVTAAGEIRVTVPLRTGRKAAEDFARQHLDWAGGILRERQANPTLLEWLQAGHCLIWGGRACRSRVEYMEDGIGRAVAGEGTVAFYLPSAHGEWLARELIVRQARRYLPRRTRELAQTHGVVVGRVSVRDQSTRWGSCSSGGTISLNWRLLLLPVATADGVILHELAHCREMNHSGRFYALLDQWDGARKENERYLRERGCLLMQLGRG